MNRERQAARIRGARRRHGRAGRGNPYPNWLKQEALAYAEARRSEGALAEQVARELDLPALTLTRWTEAAKGRFVPVVVDAPEATPEKRDGLVVRGPCGVRIEGLEISSVAALLRALA